MRSDYSIALLFGILVLAELTSEGAPIVTATNRLPNPVGATFAVPFGNSSAGEVPPAVRVAQTFTAEVGGRLHSASVTAASLNSDPTGLQLAVTAVEDGNPGAVLAVAPLQGLYVNGFFADLNALNAMAEFGGVEVMLEDQQQYALLFVTERHPINFQALGDQTIGTSRQYAGGELLRSVAGGPFTSQPIGDLLFEVRVETVPEPTALALTMVAATIGWRRVRRRHMPC